MVPYTVTDEFQVEVLEAEDIIMLQTNSKDLKDYLCFAHKKRLQWQSCC